MEGQQNPQGQWPPQGGQPGSGQPQPAFGQQPPQPAFGQPQPGSGGEPTNDERTWAAVAHGLTFFEGGIIGPLVLYLLKKDESDFVAFHALQSLYFGLAFFVFTAVTCGLGALLAVWPYMIFEVIATMKAYHGEWYELPLVGKYARERHPGQTQAGPITF